MKNHKIGLVGIGKLGTAMMKHWNKNNIAVGVYHPLNTKAERFIHDFQNGHILTKNKLRDVNIIILALPAKEIIPFISNLYTECSPPASAYIINMATAINTKEIKLKFPSVNVLGVKYMGHGRDLLDSGKGLFITETDLPTQIEELYKCLGQIKIDCEDRLIQVNKLATYYALKTAIEIETEFAKEEFSPEYVNRALTSLAPEVIRSYCEGTLGHFAKEIVKEIKLKNKKDAD